ncbi:hypothetical protein CCR75_005856 [Bremia lactucae]|uniref:Uncharacterized protein n=1 Tax=Bremia lactucae TaxID=4779 RepID=A0A976FFP8_BRELC|nr:hypothetical protein CCR75_005856 [Bremia lactucae]
MEIIDSSSSSSSLLSLPSRYHAHLTKLQQQKVTIQQLEHDKLEQAKLIKEMKHLVKLVQKNQGSEVAKLRKELENREHELLKATQLIDKLTRQVEALQAVTARAESAQRDAETDYILRHFVENDNEKGASTGPSPLEELRTELARVVYDDEQKTNRIQELEAELTWVRDAADALSQEVQSTKDAKQALLEELEEKRSSEFIVQHECKQLNNLRQAPLLLTSTSIKTNDGALYKNEQWQSMASVCQNLVKSLRDQVKTLTSDKQKLEHAINCCQQSADQRFKAFENDQKTIEAENAQLRAELTRLRLDLKVIGLQFQKLEEADSPETAVEEELMRLIQAQAHQKELVVRIGKIEQKLDRLTDTEARCQKLVVEQSDLLKQLENERCHSKELVQSTATFKETTEMAVKQLKKVEIELRVINCTANDKTEPYETIADLARMVVTSLKRQQDESVDAAVASMQVFHLTSNLEAHLSHLRAFRDKYGNCTSLMDNSRYCSELTHCK